MFTRSQQSAHSSHSISRHVRRRLLLLLTLVALVLLCAPTPQSTAQQDTRQLDRDQTLQANRASERRVALVIGNSAYDIGPLKNPINDARAMSNALRELGFDVTRKEDLKLSEMKAVIREFGAKIRRGGVGLFYYAGHGVEVRGENYLVPVDAAPESSEEVEYEAVNAGFVLAQMESAGNGMNIMILDACRDNPFARSSRSTSKGLAKMSAPLGTIIAYATAPGSVAIDGGNTGNGLYTKELLRLMQTPGLTIEEVFKRVRIGVSQKTKGKQIPWESTSLIRDFYFRKRTGNSAPDKAADIVDEETSHWENIKESVEREDFEVYLLEHPEGKHAGLARQRVQALSLSLPKTSVEPNSTSIPLASGAIQLDGVYRSINGAVISWLRFYEAEPVWIEQNGAKYLLERRGRSTRGITHVNAPEEIARWLDRLALTKEPLPPRDVMAAPGPWGSVTYTDKGIHIDYFTNENFRLHADGEGTVVDEKLLLTLHPYFGPEQTKVYEFVKVNLPVASELADRAATLGTNGAIALKGMKIGIRAAAARQEVAPQVAERLRRLGAEVDVDFIDLPEFGVSLRSLHRRITYERGQKEVARRIASLIEDLVEVDLKESKPGEMKTNEFSIILTR